MFNFKMFKNVNGQNARSSTSTFLVRFVTIAPRSALPDRHNRYMSSPGRSAVYEEEETMGVFSFEAKLFLLFSR